MDKLLLSLLARLYEIGESHEELYDSVVSEAMTDAVYFGFLREDPDYILPDSYGMHEANANRLVRNAIEDFVNQAKYFAGEKGWGFGRRLDAFQDLNITFGDQRLDYNDFFRYLPPEAYAEDGSPVARVR